MSKYTMLLLRVTISIFIISSLGQAANICANEQEFIFGLLPGLSNFLHKPDPAIRGAIFDLNRPYNSHLLQGPFLPFVEELEQSTCLPKTAVHIIRSYDEYLQFVSSSVAFVTADDCSATFGFPKSSVTWLGGNEQEEDHHIKHQFENNKVEAVFVTLEYLTHIASVSPFVMPSFTLPFVSALSALDDAAKDPNSAASKEMLQTFFRSYGTHFSKTTHIGAKLIFGKLFPRRSASVLENARDQENDSAREDKARVECVLESAVETLLSNVQRPYEPTSQRFSRIAADRCRVREIQPLVGVIGPFPRKRFNDWALEVIMKPSPIRYFAEKISSMFMMPWFNSVLQQHSISSKELDGSALYNFFHQAEMAQVSDPQILSEVERTCQLLANLRDFDYVWPAGDVGFEELLGTQDTATGKSPIKYGPVLIMGGHNEATGGGGYLSRGDAIDTWILPDLPHAVWGISLSMVGSEIYSCGGKRADAVTSSCYKLNRASSSPQWESITPLPVPMAYHSSVVIRDHIWTVYNAMLYDLDTKTNSFRTIPLPMSIGGYKCAVSNVSHSLIIGAGSAEDEIWGSTEEYNPAKWHLLGHLGAKRGQFGCLWLGQQVFITGGYPDRNDAVVFDTVTHTISSAGTLARGRAYHGMMVMDGRPAVAGGFVGKTSFSSIEIYDEESGFWTTSSRTLSEPRNSFGLVQLPG